MIRDYSSHLPHLTADERATLQRDKEAYERGESRAYLSTRLDMQSRSKSRVLDRYRSGTATRAAATDAIKKYGLEQA